MKNNEIVDGYQFWKVVDECNPYKTVLELSKKIGAKYTKIRQKRAKGTFPKAVDLYLISKETKSSMEYLMTGKKSSSSLSPRLERILFRIKYSATESDLILIERILRMDSMEDE